MKTLSYLCIRKLGKVPSDQTNNISEIMSMLSVSDVFNQTLLECTFYEDGELKTFIVPVKEYFDLVERNKAFGYLEMPVIPPTFSKESVYYWFRGMECSFYLDDTEYNYVPENVEFYVLDAPTDYDHEQLYILYNYIRHCIDDREFEVLFRECIEYYKEEYGLDVLSLH